MLLCSYREIVALKFLTKSLLSLHVHYTGPNELSLASDFEWPDNTYYSELTDLLSF
jgi:hypothetical protein